ncbi:uncharacterized protein LOC131952900 [Physella acuta]|uniref:uncharacterized protein LOC131952900 n=1 Tax=Physella acuta TaxID=109671 RepID=UPI0027DCAB8A|nr:uncharacterized protein LOC131952900 [Physella acuta]XP_059171820.1 uncharacterized protein LOC131952900 [Physella acuta]
MWNSQDSALSSHNTSSFIQDSQCSEFSQINTQDMFSQNNSGVQNEMLYHQNSKKMSMYEKWLNKRSLYKKDPQQTGVVESKSQIYNDAANNRITCLSTGNNSSVSSVNKPTAPVKTSHLALKRSLDNSQSITSLESNGLEQMKSAFLDYSIEVKNCLNFIKEKVENVADMSHEQLSLTVTAFLEDIWKNQEKLQKFIEDQNKSKATVTELEKLVAVKDSQISFLQNQLQNANRENSETLSKTIKENIAAFQLQNDQKFEEIFKLIKESFQYQHDQLDKHKTHMEKSLCQHGTLENSFTDTIAELEKKILSEINKFQKSVSLIEKNSKPNSREDFSNLFRTYNKEIMDSLAKYVKQAEKLPSGFKNMFNAQYRELLSTQIKSLKTQIDEIMKVNTSSTNITLAKIQKSVTENNELMIQAVGHNINNTDTCAILELIDERINKFLSSMNDHFHQNNSNTFANNPTKFLHSPGKDPHSKKDSAISSATYLNHQTPFPSLKNNTPSTRPVPSKKYCTRSSGCLTSNSPNIQYAKKCQSSDKILRSNTSNDGCLKGQNWKSMKHDVSSHENYVPDKNSSDMLNATRLNKGKQCMKVSSDELVGYSENLTYLSSTKQKSKNQNTENSIYTRKRSRRNSNFVVEEDMTLVYNSKQNTNSPMHSVYEPPRKSARTEFASNASENANDRMKNQQWLNSRTKPLKLCNSQHLQPFSVKASTQNDKLPYPNLTLSSFITKGFTKNDGYASDTNSCHSSPTISITQMTIKKVNARSPYRERMMPNFYKNHSFQRITSPVPTLLSDINNM